MKPCLLTVSVLAAATLLSACSGVSVQPVQAYGLDTYAVYAISKSTALARSETLNKANEHCTAMGKQMLPQPFKRIARRQFELKFSCVEPGRTQPPTN